MKRRDKENLKNMKDEELLSQIENLKNTIALIRTILRQRELTAENK